jgi:hypothetical protein
MAAEKALGRAGASATAYRRFEYEANAGSTARLPQRDGRFCVKRIIGESFD